MTTEDLYHQTLETPPIYFGVAMWGRSFCQDFLDHCLASLLASGNIPALPNVNNQNKFLFCVTPEDWEWLQSNPYFITLNQYMATEFIPIHLMSEEEYLAFNHSLSYKLRVVTQAHTLLVSKMYEAKAIGSLVFPDTIYAKNALKSIYPHILSKDKKAVLAHFSRFSTPELLTALNKDGYLKPHTPIEIENRPLLRICLKI